MASPSMVQRSGDTLIVRSVVSGDRLYLESGAPVAEPSPPASPPIQDEVDETELPQCKIKRNYDCADCDYFTQNPRHYLSHLRDVHGEKVKIYDCPHCLYASKHYQKLLRHMKMVHGVGKGAEEATAEVERKRRAPKAEPEPEEECDLEDPESGGEPGPAKKAKTELECSMCDFAANSHNQLTRHERKEHLKTKFFPCSKCNYVTHIKARFTKHVKYHSMPMIKCEVCDFRTPYKWNLDRHMKNHGGTGAFCCSACNFTADIKQSLTVHEMNHHVPAVGGGAAGGGGSNGTPPPPRRRNRVGGSDSLPAVGPSSPRAPRARRSRPRSKPAELERISPEPESFSDLAEITLAERVEPEEEPKAPKKTPRPIPNLIPLQVNGVPPPLKSATPLDLCTSFKNEDNDEEQQSRPTLKKKSTSIFEKLYKEKLMTVGDDRISPKPPSVEGKRINGLSTETSRISGSGSTRCQRCRHRCKSSNDLVLHMQTCVAKRDEAEAPAIPASEEEGSADDPQAPHPMENVVFVWNSMLKKTDSFDDSEQHFDGAAVASSSTPKREKEAAGGKRVFKCPHCSFWASTASRFHVHIVGHLNRKPFECSLCSYKSNWRWDITKHIRLKSVRDPDHAKARVLMTDETGRRNYSKYNKYLTLTCNMRVSDTSADAVGATGSRKSREMIRVVPDAFETDMQPATSGDNVKPFVDIKLDERKNTNEVCVEAKKTKKTMWKCKKCDYR